MWGAIGLAAAAAYVMASFRPDRLFAPDGREIWPKPRIPLRVYAPDGVALAAEGLPRRRVYAPDGRDLDPGRGLDWRESAAELSQEGIRWQRTWGPSLSPDVPVETEWYLASRLLGYSNGSRVLAPNGRDLVYEAAAEKYRQNSQGAAGESPAPDVDALEELKEEECF